MDFPLNRVMLRARVQNWINDNPNTECNQASGRDKLLAEMREDSPGFGQKSLTQQSRSLSNYLNRMRDAFQRSKTRCDARRKPEDETRVKVCTASACTPP